MRSFGRRYTEAVVRPGDDGYEEGGAGSGTVRSTSGVRR